MMFKFFLNIQNYNCCLYSCNARTYANIIGIATCIPVLKLNRYWTMFIIDQSKYNSINNNVFNKEEYCIL